MEQRSEPRFDENRPVRVTVLREPQRELAGRIENVSGRGMRIALDQPVPGREVVKLEWDGTLLLGEVCYCEREPGGYGVGVKLEHALFDTHELARLARKLAGEPELEPSHGHCVLRGELKRPHPVNHGDNQDG
jgi:hypothetical protein